MSILAILFPARQEPIASSMMHNYTSTISLMLARQGSTAHGDCAGRVAHWVAYATVSIAGGERGCGELMASCSSTSEKCKIKAKEGVYDKAVSTAGHFLAVGVLFVEQIARGTGLTAEKEQPHCEPVRIAGRARRFERILLR